MERRFEHVDILKGILIVTVVLGHLPFGVRDFVHWFHMPAFFVTTGLFLNFEEVSFKSFLMSNFKKLIIPYFVWSVLLSLPFFFVNLYNLNFESVMSRIGLLIYGGEELKGYYAVFWFITVYFVSLTILSFIAVFIKKPRLFFIVSFGIFLVGLAEGFLHNYYNYTIFWNVNVAFVSQFFIYCGYRLRKQILYGIISNINFVVSLIVFLGVAIILSLLDYNHDVDLKYAKYSNPVLMIFLLTLFFILALKISDIISRFKLLSLVFIFAGKNTLIIMYLHMAVFLIIDKLFNIPVGLLAIFAMLLPSLLGIIIQQNSNLKCLLLGSYSNIVKSEKVP